MSSLIRVEDLNDSRLESYRKLKDRDLAADGNRFIAESEQVTRRLIAAGIEIESFLIAEKRLERLEACLPAAIPAYVLADDAIEKVIGFRFHSGVLACGFRPPSLDLSRVIETLPARATLMFLPDVNNTENLGTLMRVAAGFGVSALLLGPTCCDPFYRQAVRVSMGSVFALKLVRLSDSLDAISRLQAAGIQCLATVLNSKAEPLSTIQRAAKTAVLFGNESYGLSDAIIERCNQRLTIPMELGTDSLNIAVAAGIVMHHLTRVTTSKHESD